MNPTKFTSEQMQFATYLADIAPEGETVLFVRQKPRKDRDGKLQYHKDGAVKCTWPAFLPERYKSDGAWYANTGCFIISRFIEGQVSASAANCERVAFLVLDDIGTKSKTPPLAPTWIIETSRDNYQWGYTFGLDDQPRTGEFAAAIKAIAQAGYTDGGAINPVRNFRLPGSVNLKPGKGDFAARLVELHIDREFTLAGICAALGVEPGEADTAVRQRLAVADDGLDDVLRWLDSSALVLEGRNPEGWYGVQCPNHAEHSDGNPMGRYMPVTRAYTCFHEHCGDWDSRRFLEWVDAEGGPKHAPGLRDDLLAATMTSALSVIAPTDTFPDRAREVIAQVEAREIGRTDKADWWQRFAYIESDDSYFDLVERREFPRHVFNALFRATPCASIHGGRRVEASVCFDENRQAMGARTLAGITYAAGEGQLVTQNGLVYGNRWRDARVALPSDAGDITPWLAHAELLIPNDAERNHVFDVMACKLQNPRAKINHAVLHAGTQGCGKDTLWHPLIWAVCGSPPVNKGLVDADSLSSQWGYALEAEILVLNELRDPDAGARRALANRLKPIIAAPPEMLSINRKNLHPYDMVNRLFVLAFSNDRVPIMLESQDRRWFALYSNAPRMSPAAAVALWRWYGAGGAGRVAAWLAQRDVSAFDPAATPMATEYKLSLVEQGMSHAESWLVDLIRQRVGEFSLGVVASPFYALLDRLQGMAPNGVRLVQPALLHALDECGWRDMGRIMSQELTTRKWVWAAPDVAAYGYSKSELRRMAEGPVSPPTLSLVTKKPAV